MPSPKWVRSLPRIIGSREMAALMEDDVNNIRQKLWRGSFKWPIEPVKIGKSLVWITEDVLAHFGIEDGYYPDKRYKLKSGEVVTGAEMIERRRNRDA